MPIYEFYCPDCHAIFSFLSKSVNTTGRPDCPRCGRRRLSREVSMFATGKKGRTEDSGNEDLPVDEARMEQAFSELANDAEGLDEDNPQQAARLMKISGEGRIVNISSLGGLRPWAMHAHYCASKAGVIMLTRALAKAFAPAITVNSVAPGVIPFPDIDERGLAMIRSTPAARGGTPEEIADAVAYFLKASNFVTGQILAVDGGLSLK